MAQLSSVSTASFRDPAGFVFFKNGLIKRAVTMHGKNDYDLFMSSGLYDALRQRGWIIAHTEEPVSVDSFHKIIAPVKIPVWTYPYEWCFSQLKDAAVLTLKIQLLALQHGLSLKDATPFNIQFFDGKPILIDTLSFESFRERPWFGYRQFCEMFLAPLALMAEKRLDFNRFLAVDLSGINLGFASRLMPLNTWFRFGYLTHLHLHAASQSHFEGDRANADADKPALSLKFPKTRMISLMDNLLSCVRGIRLKSKKTAFSDYYEQCGHYSKEADEFKMETVRRWAKSRHWDLALDLGGNTGRYSRILTKEGVRTVCADFDPYCVEQNYLISKKEDDLKMLPIQLDITNPTPDLGWANEERSSLSKRLSPDLVMCLALVHHLRISAGIPMELVARYLAGIAPCLIIEFVPKGDPMVTRLLKNRDDIFFDYDVHGFEEAFRRYFSVEQKVSIPSTARTLYFLKKK